MERTEVFCESQYFGCPEVANTLSSFAFCLFPLLSYYYSSSKIKKNKFYRLYISYTFVLGIASGAYHLTCALWGRFFDESTMIILTCSIIIFHTDNILKSILYTLYYCLLLTWNTILRDRQIFSLFYILPILTLLFLNNPEPLLGMRNWEEAKRAYRSAKKILFIACLIWLITEQTCVYDNRVALLHGHVIWHISMAHAMNVIFIYIMYTKMISQGKNIYFQHKNGIYYICYIYE
jgi:hypothetical protein